MAPLSGAHEPNAPLAPKPKLRDLFCVTSTAVRESILFETFLRELVHSHIGLRSSALQLAKQLLDLICLAQGSMHLRKVHRAGDLEAEIRYRDLSKGDPHLYTHPTTQVRSHIELSNASPGYETMIAPRPSFPYALIIQLNCGACLSVEGPKHCGITQPHH